MGKESTVLPENDNGYMPMREGLYRARAMLAATALACLAVPAQAPAAPVHGQFVVVTEYFRYVPGTTADLTITQGSTLTLVNLDPIGGDHTMTSDALNGTTPLFDSAAANSLSQTTVNGIATLPPRDYPFHCSIHFGMRGVLHVIAEPV